MSETNKVMSSLQFLNTEQPYQVNDARIPANPGAYKYMATDGEGNWVAEDRLAYDGRMTIEWDGNTEGRAAIVTPGGTYYKASNYIPTDEELKNAKYCFTQEGYPDDWYNVKDSWDDSVSEGTVTDEFAIIGSIFVAKKANISIMGVIDVEESGIYLFNTENGYVSELQIGAIKKIPDEFLPTILTSYYIRDDEWLYYTVKGAYKGEETDRVTKADVVNALESGYILLKYAGLYSEEIKSKSVKMPIDVDYTDIHSYASVRTSEGSVYKTKEYSAGVS